MYSADQPLHEYLAAGFHIGRVINNGTAEKFIGQAQQLMRDIPVIENNLALQQRIQAAAGYFLPLLEKLKGQLQQHPLITEHKESATLVDENLETGDHEVELNRELLNSGIYLMKTTIGDQTSVMKIILE